MLTVRRGKGASMLSEPPKSELLKALDDELKQRPAGALELHVQSEIFPDIAEALDVGGVATHDELAQGWWRERTVFQVKLHRTRVQVHALGRSAWSLNMVSVLFQQLDPRGASWGASIRWDGLELAWTEPALRAVALDKLAIRLPLALREVPVQPDLLLGDLVRSRTGKPEGALRVLRFAEGSRVECLRTREGDEGAATRLYVLPVSDIERIS